MQMNWPNVNNCSDFAPFFILFLDCVHQLINMNPNQFQFTTHYLAQIAFNMFTNKFFETTQPCTTNDKNINEDEIKLLSIF